MRQSGFYRPKPIKIINANGIEVAAFSQAKMSDGLIKIHLQPGVYLAYGLNKFGKTVDKLIVY
jgi:hypothetical protein